MRLIDADVLIKQCKPRGIADEVWKESNEYKQIINAPTIDAVPVVRCKNCHHAEYIKLLQEHINRQDIIIRKAIAKLKMGCAGCVHYDQQQTAMICRDCKRYHKDMYEEW